MQPVSHNGALNGKVSDDVSENKGLFHECWTMPYHGVE